MRRCRTLLYQIQCPFTINLNCFPRYLQCFFVYIYCNLFHSVHTCLKLCVLLLDSKEYRTKLCEFFLEISIAWTLTRLLVEPNIEISTEEYIQKDYFGLVPIESEISKNPLLTGGLTRTDFIIFRKIKFMASIIWQKLSQYMKGKYKNSE